MTEIYSKDNHDRNIFWIYSRQKYILKIIKTKIYSGDNRDKNIF